MKLASYTLSDDVTLRPRVGMVVSGQAECVDLLSAYSDMLVAGGAEPMEAISVADSLFGEMGRLIGLGAFGMRQAATAVEHAYSQYSHACLALKALRLQPPLMPRTLRDCSMFREHIRRAKDALGTGPVPQAWFRAPSYYKLNPNGVIGTDSAVPWPSESTFRDYEAELAIVIGRSGTRISVEQARNYIFGLTIMNDFTARDLQVSEAEVGFGPMRSKDFATALGPYLVTLDELAEVQTIELVVRVNGGIASHVTLADMQWEPEEVVAYLSRCGPLTPGDVIGLGAVPDGSGVELGRRLEHGDVVEIEATGIGVLRNRIENSTPEPTSPWLRRSRHEEVAECPDS
jgi:2-keto-4-pentenoate hydratase/2-oxohepta-3-ene-1,7-dioic acid hydratase in catechol pathway